MQYTGIIYKYTDPFGKSYVGQTTNPRKENNSIKAQRQDNQILKIFILNFIQLLGNQDGILFSMRY